MFFLGGGLKKNTPKTHVLLGHGRKIPEKKHEFSTSLPLTKWMVKEDNNYLPFPFGTANLFSGTNCY